MTTRRNVLKAAAASAAVAGFPAIIRKAKRPSP